MKHKCHFPSGAPGWQWTCQECWTTYIAESAGPLDIRWVAQPSKVTDLT